MTSKPDFSSLYPYVHKELSMLPPDELQRLVDNICNKEGVEPFIVYSIDPIKRMNPEDLPSFEHCKESNRKPLDQKTLDSWKI